MFVSEYFDVDLEGTGVFDALLDKDSNFFINIVRLKHSTTPEFEEAYQAINQYFADIATLLANADSPDTGDALYREAGRRFQFHEVNGVNLGFSKSGWGVGWGNALSQKILRDAYQIVQKGSMQPEIFHLVGLFEENIAGDLLSDMIATIIEPHIRQYTLNVMQRLGVGPQTRPDIDFTFDGLALNPFKRGVPILLLPEEILHELPIAKDWYDIDRVARQNAAIRREMGVEIGIAWEKWASGDRKRYLRENVFMVPETCKRVIEGYRSVELSSYDLLENPDYAAETLLRNCKQDESFKSENKRPSSLEGAMEVIAIFKDWVENNRGWAEVQEVPSRQREKAVQRFVHLGAKYYVEVNDLDLSFEPNEGRGPVDVKLSRGGDKTVAEIKLSSNKQCKHGYEVQVKEYGKAERTRNLVYVLVDVGNPGVVADIQKLHAYNKRGDIPCPELVIVDAKPRKPASTYIETDGMMAGLPNEAEMSAQPEGFNFDVPEFDLPSFDGFDLHALIDDVRDQLFEDGVAEDDCGD